VDENGNWSYTPETDLAEGDHSLTVAAVDKAGQEGPQVSGTDDGSWDFTVDTTAPDNITSGIVEGSITLTDDVGPVTGSIADGSVTDDARPTYAGKVTADIDHVNIYDNGSLIGSAPVDENGTWSFTPDNALASGGHGLTVSAVDAAGNEGPQVSGTADDSWDFTLLTSAPAQPSIENIVDDYTQGEDADTGTLQKGQATNDATLTLNGSGAPGLTVQIWATDSDNKRVMVGEGTVGEDSRWSITTSALGADGIYNLTATAVNAAGVSSAETGVFPIELDTTLPAAAVAVLNDDQGDVQGVVAADGVTDDRSPTLSGTGEAGATVSVYLDGSNTAAGSVVVGDDGTWSLALATLSDGAHSYQTKITDKAGNETRGEVVNFTVDSSAVVLTIDQANDDAGPITGAVLNGGMTDDTSPELQGTTTAGATVTIKDADNKVLGTAVADADGKWTFPLSNVADGEHTWTAEVTGSTGNTAQATITLTVDSTAPAAPVITAMVDDVGTVQGTSTVSGSVTDDPAPTFSGTADAGTTITIYDGDNVLGTVVANKDGEWSYTPTTNLVDGEHTITVTSTDTVGNESAHSPAWDFTLDTSTDAPVIITNTTDEISGTAEPGATVTITDPSDNSETSVVADEDGKWSIQPNPLETGDTGATVVVTDAAGNTNSTIVDGPSDTTPPDNITSGIVNGSISLTDDVAPVTGTIADGSSTNDARPTYAGQATADIDHVNIYDNGILIGSAPVGEDGTWSFTPETDLAAGEHVFTVSAVDSANNEGPQVSGTSDEGWNFTLDTTPPGADAFEEGSITLTDNVGPVQGSIEDGSTTDDAQPTYAGKITAAGLADGVVSVNIYDNGTLIGSAPVDQTTGVWSFTPGSAMDSGDHALTVSAVDAAGNEGPQTSGTADESWDFSLLTSAPAQPSIESINDDYTQGEDADIGYLQKGQSTNDSTLTVNGTAGAGMTVQIWATDSSNHRVQVGEGQVNKDGRWSITTSELGDDGTYTLTATAVNAAGVPSAETGGFPIILDTVAPDVAVATLMDNEGDKQGEIAPGETTDDRSPTLTGTGEAGATVSVYLDGSTTPVGNVVVDAEGNWTLSLGTLTDGEHSYKTKITDAAGNETQGEVVNFTVDSSAVELTIDQANDDAGTITGAVLTNGLTDDTSPQLQGTATPGATVTIKDEANTVLGTAVVNASGQWTFQLDGVTDGTHTWTAETTNAANNTAQATITLTIDSMPPAAPVITSLGDDVGTVQFTSKVQGNMTDDPAPTLTGTAEAGSTVTIYDGTSVLGTVTANAEGEWSYTPTTNLVEGTHSITATATDAAGNVSESSDSWNFILDITAPNVGISDNSADSLAGQSEPGALVTVETTNGDKFTAVANEDGRWIITPNPIAAGESGKIYATDPAGNVGDPVSFQGSALASYDLLNESTQVNTTTAGDQANPTTTRLADGRIVVIWQGAGTGIDIYMQLYEADGVHKIGTEQQINQRISSNQDSAQVVALADGGFLVVYESYGGGLDNDQDGVVARRYGSDGQAVTDEFLVNVTTAGSQRMASAVALDDGGYIITWVDQAQSVVQRTYDADNQPTTGEVTVATGTS
ncbi:Ig-like domain-containing protein, partial [Enterobacter sp. UNJFSC 003]|uniref:Ig-like domain-containing protein n=1 Tax=Enterobacter sp. UNJFSC 003 TaxID=3122077 RepID=UPI002ECEBD88|nr:Ig-like domain-containing protein [Serratia liquefaciens]